LKLLLSTFLACDPVLPDRAVETGGMDTAAAPEGGTHGAVLTTVDVSFRVQGAVHDTATRDASLAGTTLREHAYAIISGQGGSDHAGQALAAVGDLNQDGVPDLGVGAPEFMRDTENETGAVMVFHGLLDGTFEVGEADAILLGDQHLAAGGSAVDAAGDLDADGVPDLVVGAPAASGGGEAYVVWGASEGTVEMSKVGLLLEGTTASRAGTAVAGGGDLDGDGLDDLVVGAPDARGENQGAIFLIGGALGRPKGPVLLSEVRAISGLAKNQQLGSAAVLLGDVDGDGFTDLGVGGEGSGYAWVVYGGEHLAELTSGAYTDVSDVESASFQGGGSAGSSLAAPGDVNGDGYRDLLLGAFLFDEGAKNRGAVHLVHGPFVGLTDVDDSSVATFDGVAAEDRAGWAVAAGDLDGDDLVDVVVGAKEADGVELTSGAAYVLFGPLTGSRGLDAPDGLLMGGATSDRFGTALAVPGDLDGDGWVDLAVGAYGAAGWDGEVMLFSGGPAGP